MNFVFVGLTHKDEYNQLKIHQNNLSQVNVTVLSYSRLLTHIFKVQLKAALVICILLICKFAHSHFKRVENNNVQVKNGLFICKFRIHSPNDWTYLSRITRETCTINLGKKENTADKHSHWKHSLIKTWKVMGFICTCRNKPYHSKSVTEKLIFNGTR